MRCGRGAAGERLGRGWFWIPRRFACCVPGERLPLWKPNSALVVVDFAVRHGYVSPDEPGFVEIIHLLRAGGFGTE